MILALRALGVGDLATSVPAIRGLRAAFPGRTLAVAAPGWLTPLIDLIGGVDRIVPIGGLDTPIGRSPQIAVNLHGCGPESHRLMQATHPGELWAFANVEAGHLDAVPELGQGATPRHHRVRRAGEPVREQHADAASAGQLGPGRDGERVVDGHLGHGTHCAR